MSRRATKASMSALWVVSNAPGVVGKFVEVVTPATVAAPCAPRAMAEAPSPSVPPRKVE